MEKLLKYQAKIRLHFSFLVLSPNVPVSRKAALKKLWYILCQKMDYTCEVDDFPRYLDSFPNTEVDKHPRQEECTSQLPLDCADHVNSGADAKYSVSARNNRDNYFL